MAMPLTLGGATWSRLLSRARCEGGPLHAAPSLVDHHGSRATVPTWDQPGGEAGTNPTHIGEAPLKPLGAAGAQQLCSTKPREPPRVGPPAPVQCPATLRKGLWWSSWWGSLDGIQGVRGSNPLSSTTTTPQVNITARPSPHSRLSQCRPAGAASGPRAP